MAIYKKFSGNWDHQLKFDTSYVQNIEQNKTTFYISNIEIGGGWAINYSINKQIHFTVNDVRKSININRLDLKNYRYKKIGDLSFDVIHDASGNQQIKLNIESDLSTIVYQQFRFGTLSYNDTIILPQILRPSELTGSVPNEISTSNAVINTHCTIRNREFETICELSYTDPLTKEWRWLGVSILDSEQLNIEIPRSFLDEIVSKFPNQSYAHFDLLLLTRKRGTHERVGNPIWRTIKLKFGDEYKPQINHIMLFDEYSLSGIYDTNAFIQELSAVDCNVQTTAKNGATIVKYTVELGKDKKEYTTQNFILNFSQPGKIDAIFKVEDSRGLIQTETVPMSIIPYFKPRIKNFLVKRSLEVLNKVLIDLNIEKASVYDTNVLISKVFYREKGQNDWLLAKSFDAVYTDEFNEESYMLPITFDKDKTYEIKLEVNDAYNQSSEVVEQIGTGIVTLVLIPKGVSVGNYPTQVDLHGLQVHGVLIDENGIGYLKELKPTPIKVENFGAGFENYGNNELDVSYYKDGLSRIYLQGTCKTSTNNKVIFTLPQEYRPQQPLYFLTVCYGYNACAITIRANGEVVVEKAESKNWISLDGISFLI